jgi:teichuronic acid biosynthesis glycosyltransferase TuaC
MRLLFVSNLFPDQREPYRGLDNATLLHALRDRAEIHTLALRPALPWSRRHWKARAEDASLRPQYVRTSYIPRIGHRWNHLLYARAIRPALAALRQAAPFDAVLASWLFPDACAVARILKTSSERFVAIAQGSDVHHYLRIPARKKIITTELHSTSAIVTRSAELARLLAEAGLPQERLHPIYNGVDAATFHPRSREERLAARAAMGIPPAAPMVLFVGNFLLVKNPALLIAAHARLVRFPGMEETRLVLIGGGPLESALRSQATSAGTDQLVIFAGRQDPPGVARAMHAADLLALTSWNEGVPNVILEAFATGLPVVATRVGGIAEVFPSEHLGMLTPAGDEDAFTRALHSVASRQADQERIAAHGRSFDWARAADSYFRLLAGGDDPRGDLRVREV